MQRPLTLCYALKSGRNPGPERPHDLTLSPLWLPRGDVLVVSRYVYGGVEAVIAEDLPRFGIEVRRFDPFESGSLERAVAGGAAHIHVETPTNPLCRVVDLERVVAVARGCGALVSVDATFLPPPFQRPLAHGVDLVMHSATKILGGHSDAHAGVVSGRHELLERLEGFRRRTGAVLAPDTAWLLTRSLPTLELRTQRACENAARLAEFLDGLRQEKRGVAAVHYPGLPQHPDHATAQRYMRAYGYMLAFEVAGGLEAAVRVYDRFGVVGSPAENGASRGRSSCRLSPEAAPATQIKRPRAPGRKLVHVVSKP